METGIEFDERELMRDLDRLSDAVETRVSRKAVMAGSSPILREMKSEVPEDEGTLRKSLGRKSKVYGRETAVAMTGPRVRGKHQGYHGHLIERGHIAADGSFVPGDPFMERAQKQSEAAARRAMLDKLDTEVQREAAKL